MKEFVVFAKVPLPGTDPCGALNDLLDHGATESMHAYHYELRFWKPFQTSTLSDICRSAGQAFASQFPDAGEYRLKIMHPQELAGAPAGQRASLLAEIAAIGIFDHDIPEECHGEWESWKNALDAAGRQILAVSRFLQKPALRAFARNCGAINSDGELENSLYDLLRTSYLNYRYVGNLSSLSEFTGKLHDELKDG